MSEDIHVLEPPLQNLRDSRCDWCLSIARLASQVFAQKRGPAQPQFESRSQRASAFGSGCGGAGDPPNRISAFRYQTVADCQIDKLANTTGNESAYPGVAKL